MKTRSKINHEASSLDMASCCSQNEPAAPTQASLIADNSQNEEIVDGDTDKEKEVKNSDDDIGKDKEEPTPKEPKKRKRHVGCGPFGLAILSALEKLTNS